MVVVLKPFIFHEGLVGWVGLFLHLICCWMNAVSETGSPPTTLSPERAASQFHSRTPGKEDEQVKTVGKMYPQGHI